MIRKQFYLHPVQDAALKRKAHSLGISQAELVRRALDNALSEHLPATQKNGALEAFLENSLLFSRSHRLADACKFKREDVYSSEPRFTRWGQH